MKITWEVDDGYVGGSRPQSTEVDDSDIEDCYDVDEAMELIDDMIDADYETKVSWYIKNREKVIEQVKKILENKEEEEY